MNLIGNGDFTIEQVGAGNLKFEEARDQLRYAIRNQKTISIPKLRVLLSSTRRTSQSDEICEEKRLSE